MGLNRLDNFLKSVRGAVIHVNPDSLDASDAIDNQGNSAARPFITIQRALIEAARFSYQSGLDNDRFDKTTIIVYPGEHVIDNRPGWIPNWQEGSDPSYLLRNGTQSTEFRQLDYRSNFNVNDPNNDLYKFNSIHGGVIIPRGASIVGMDLRKTKIRPKYVPNPENDSVQRSAVFRVTGGSYLWKFSIFDANPNGEVYKDYSSNVFLPNFSHHKLTAFEYADGTNPVTIDDDYIQEFSTTRTDLDIYYNKIGLAYGSTTGREISNDYPSASIDIQSKVDEYRIVGSRGVEVLITSIISGDGIIPTTTITVEFENPIPGIEVDTPIQIQGIPIEGYNGQFVVSEVVDVTTIKYKTSSIPDNADPTAEQISGSTISLISDTVTSASPYIFNVSLRSVYGMCGLHADGSKADGFKSIVVAQFTGIGLQKDDRAFVKYDPVSGLYQDRTSVANLFSDSRALFKPEYQNYHIKASNNAFIQIVSVFAIGYAEHFRCESGGDLSITNSNSNFGAKSLVAEGYRPESFEKDDIGYITHVISPQEIQNDEINIEFESIDITKTLAINNSSRLYLYNQTNQDIIPENVIDGYRIGAKKNDTLNVLLPISGSYIEKSAEITMQGSSQISYEKSYKVAKKVNNINNEINANTFTLTEDHEFINGESVRIVSDTGQLPDGLKSQIYYVITSDINGSLADNEIRLASTLNDALNGDDASSAISIYSNEQSNLRIVSKVSDKRTGNIGHPIQWDNFNSNWYILVNSSNDIFTSLSGVNQTTTRSYIKRISELRNVTDSIYKVRYVIPKDSPLTARPPLDGYVIQDSSSTTGETSEIVKYHSLTSRQLSNSTELRNFRFISNATWTNNVATFTTELPHDLIVGNKVEIKNVKSINNVTGLFNVGFNAEFEVIGTPTRRTFTVNLIKDPGTFTNNTSVRDENLPYFRRSNFKGTFVIYRSQEIQPYIKDQQDGVYHLLLVNSSYSPLGSPFNGLRFSQPIQNLYPQVNRDNPNSDPKAASSFAVSYPIGQVAINDPELSLTKETLNKFNDDLNVGLAVTDIASDSVGVSHTIYTNIEHGLNRIVTLSIINPGLGYGYLSGVSGTLYNASLVGLAGSTTGSGANAVISHNNVGSITGIKVIDGGSSYSVGDQLEIVGTATTTGYSVARVQVTAIYNNVGDVISIDGVKSDNLNDYDEYNNLYRITDITTGNTKSFQVSSASTITNSTTIGIGFTYARDSRLTFTGKSTQISTISYSNISGIATVLTSSVHGLKLNNKIRIANSNNNFFNNDFVITKVITSQSFEINCGISTVSQTHSGTGYIYRNSFVSNGGKITKTNENISGRLTVEYAGITTTLQTNINDPNQDQIVISGIDSLDFQLGDYIIINDEIMRIKRTITGNPVDVYRGVLGTRKVEHTAESVIRRIRPRPIEFRRNSIIRASGHTFEYVGFGPGNYSTALPEKQDRQLSGQEELLAQSTKIDGGITVFTGMNDAGDFYIGNKKVSSATGQEEVFDTPIPTFTGEELDINIGGLSVGFDVLTPLEVSINRSIYVGGGNDNNIISKFDGPVIFTNKLTSKSEKGIEVSSIFIQGDAATSRKYTVGISTPTIVGNTGDITYNANPVDDGYVGWIYTTQNNWRRFAPIQNQDGSYFGVWSGTFVGDGSGLANVSDIWAGNAIGIATSRLVGINTSTAKSGISLFVDGSSEFSGIVTFTNTTQSTSKDTGAVVVEGGVGIEKNLNVGGDFNVVGVSSFTGTVYFNNVYSATFEQDVTFESDLTVENNLYVNDDLYLRNQPFRSIVSGYSIVFGI